ncbi:hypothetical protein H7H82_16495 [Mycobacterium heidelbergense]|uniref:hypothetical protein n=1 Tax=Mycobacterium heidelbergense TaxID=53376 RepID=UPI00114F93A7|nr:hypothetical protein [Mycobacterium heidelbergense]MCV7052175.1 hypothetical protein [Mycobacterium heidelbergense]BBZ52878.1 hypothetical protein MHEI_45950 [Mycobacterium heidelbergense]
MDLAARPHITAAVALASAAVLAAGPIAQHLPDLHVAQELRHVSMSEINLTDAASGTMDLFSGVENELASLVGGAAATAVPADTLTSIESWLPIQTWNAVAVGANTNIASLVQQFEAEPFPLLQQVAANWLQYGVEYVTPFKTSSKNLLLLTTSAKPGSGFVAGLQNAWALINAGNISGAVSQLEATLFQNLAVSVGQPLEETLTFPGQILQNLTNAYNYLTGPILAGIGTQLLLNVPAKFTTSLGNGLQAIYNSWVAADPSGLATNILNLPGAVTNATLNGLINKNGLYNGGILSEYNGLVQALFVGTGQNLATQIVAPGSQNISTGGSLQVAAQTFINTLTQGWPAWGTYLNSQLANIPGELTAALQNLPSTLPQLLSGFAGAAGAFASQLGTLLINLLKLL